jgi:ribosome-binding protein aMBF1 (putative translation factor)
MSAIVIPSSDRVGTWTISYLGISHNRIYPRGVTGAESRDRNWQRWRALLRQVREEAGLRQSELAKRLGRPQSYVSKYESGERRLDIVELDEICAVLGIPLQKLVRRFEESSR